jgi:excisionase family DNA binding protein
MPSAYPFPTIERLPQAPEGKPERVQGFLEVSATLEELRGGQARLLQEVQGMREDIATFLKKQNQRPRDESLLTVKEVAELLSVSQHAIYGLAERGEGPPFTRIGRSLRFRRRDVLDCWRPIVKSPPTGGSSSRAAGAQRRGSAIRKSSWRRSGSWPTPRDYSIPWASP